MQISKNIVNGTKGNN